MDAKRQRLQVIADVGGCVINGDRSRLLQIIWNLLSNATKYTPRDGKIQVVLRCVNSHAQITVTDTGEGIPRDTLPYVFDRFQRGDGTMTRRYGGLGLGLSIVRQMVELHGGIVTAHSDGPGKGTTFTVTLPLPAFERRRALDEPVGSHADPDETTLPAGLRVFLIEDHTDSRELLCRILESRGAEVVTFDRAAPVYDEFEERRPDIVISDLEMPNEDGFTMLRKLRALEHKKGWTPVPAIAVSAHAVGDTRLHALRSGYQVFFSKPVKPAELVAAVVSLSHRPHLPQP